MCIMDENVGSNPASRTCKNLNKQGTKMQSILQQIFLANDLVEFSWGFTLVAFFLMIGLLLDERLRNRIE
jgi:hypothetical protein